MAPPAVWTRTWSESPEHAPHARPGAKALRDLQVRHLHAVPLESLSIHLGETIVLERRGWSRRWRTGAGRGSAMG